MVATHARAMTPEAFRALRVDTLQWTQEQLAEALGVDSVETIRRWEKGERKVSKTVQILLGYIVREQGNF